LALAGCSGSGEQQDGAKAKRKGPAPPPCLHWTKGTVAGSMRGHRWSDAAVWPKSKLHFSAVRLGHIDTVASKGGVGRTAVWDGDEMPAALKPLSEALWASRSSRNKTVVGVDSFEV